MNKRYRVSEETDYKTWKKFPALSEMEVDKEGKKLRMAKRYSGLGFLQLVDPSFVFKTPEEALNDYREKLVFKIMKAQEELSDLQSKLDSLPIYPSQLPRNKDTIS